MIISQVFFLSLCLFFLWISCSHHLYSFYIDYLFSCPFVRWPIIQFYIFLIYFYYYFKLFIVIQVQLSTFTPLYSPQPQPSPPPSPDFTPQFYIFILELCLLNFDNNWCTVKPYRMHLFIFIKLLNFIVV